MKKKLKWLFLLLCLLLGIGAAACFFLYRPAPKVIDETENGQAEEEEKNSGDGEKENSATLNKSVHAYVDDEAEQINAAISDVTWSEGEIFIHFPESADVEIKELQTGEIFWLEGSEDTPLKDTYIGKIASNTQSNGTVILSVTSPQIDEVFDEFYVDEEMGITASQIRSISAVEGVEVTPVDVIGEDFLQTAGRRGEEIEDLTYTRFVKPDVEQTASVPLGSFEISLNADLSNLIRQDQSQVENAESGDEAPVCKLTGKLGVEDLKLNLMMDFNKSGCGMKNLSVGISGRQVMQAGLELSFDGEISGETTEADILSAVKLQGLKEKVFPIVYFDCTPGLPFEVKMLPESINKEVEKTYKLRPFSCGFMVYMDIYGNLSLKAITNYQYSDEFSCNLVMVRNSQNVGKFEGKSDPEKEFSAELKASADADVHVGASAMAYFFNINVADVAVVKLGAEAEGVGTFTASSKEEDDQGLDASLYARLYLQAIDAKASLRVQADLWNIVNLSAGFEFEKTLLDLTLAETGQKKDTHYDYNTMAWQRMTAEDAQAIYYKGLDGHLFSESKAGLYRKEIYSKEFFSICGLDESYVYVLEPSEEEQYDVRRIVKDGTTSKVILEDVKYILMQDEDKMYYVPGIAPKAVYTLDRTSLKSEKFADFENDVEYMTREEEGYFVVTQKDTPFAWLIGPECVYYRLNKEKAVTNTYEDEIAPRDCVKTYNAGYYASFKLISNGYLRETATEGYWMSKDQGAFVEAEGCSGWNPEDAGIFTELENEGGGYRIMLYQAADGGSRVITDVESKHAFFTMVEDDKGRWYYMDQTEDSLRLYQMEADFTGKILVDEISLADASYSMEECNMEIVDNRLFFYTMPEWSTSKVLYRLNLY